MFELEQRNIANILIGFKVNRFRMGDIFVIQTDDKQPGRQIRIIFS
ncbi:MAG: hypothetical protein U5K27_06065 [Desulfotignum sp.]|nr:hypothetical protein [Desulfotignum sp.]